MSRVVSLVPRRCVVLLLGGALCAATPAVPGRAESARALTQEEAIQAALSRHPDLAAFQADFRAAEGRVLQASLRPNPELDFEIGNLADEVSLGVSHPLELGGKRQARIRKAESEEPVLRADLERLRLDLVASVRRAFVTLLRAKEALGLRREALDLARRLAETVAEKVKAGAVSPIEETRARVALAATGAEAARAEREVKEAKVALAAAMGDTRPTFSEAAGRLEVEIGVPEWSAVAERVSANPDLARWSRERGLRQAALESERSLSAQDLSLRGGVSYDREAGSGMVTLGISIPLPFYDKNQGAIREAEAALAKTDGESRSSELRLRSELAQRYEALTASALEARLLREEALTGAQQAYDAVNEGYRLGKFRYLDVLDAASALVQVKVQHLEALEAMHLARVDLDRLVGEPSLPADAPVKP